MSMDYDIFMNDIIQTARREMTQAGYKELTTLEEVDESFKQEGTTFVMVNSTCGCAGGVARPAASYATSTYNRPSRFVTVFAGQDKEATARAREYFTDYPPSSPSFALLKDGKIVKMIERFEIEGSEPMAVASKIEKLFDKHC